MTRHHPQIGSQMPVFVSLGLLNVALAAPPWMQIVHLLVSQCLWVVVWLSVLSFWRQPALGLSTSR